MKKNKTLKGMLLAVAVAVMSFCFSSCTEEVALESVNTYVPTSSPPGEDESDAPSR